MNIELEVARGGRHIGYVFQDASGEWSFTYTEAAIGAPTSENLLSLKYPPREAPYRGADLTSWFRNLLPDGSLKRALVANLGLSDGNDFALLGAIAGDCAGDISIGAPGERLAGEREIRVLTETELRNVLAALPIHPLLSGVEGARFSLAGEHHKIPLRVVDEQLALALGDVRSSHIAKPAKVGLKESVMNEGFCLELARNLRLPVADATVRHGEASVLLSERVDRFNNGDDWFAIHSEDLNQLMAVPPEVKFEREGGLSAADCVSAIRRYSAMPAVDLRNYLRWLMLNYLVGNGGGHAKQLALRHLPEGPRLAPFYGIFSTHVYAHLNPRLAMRLGGEDRPDWILPIRWREFSAAAGIKPKYVIALLREMAREIAVIAAGAAEHVQRQYGYASIIRDIRGLIETRARQTLVALEAEGERAGRASIRP